MASPAWPAQPDAARAVRRARSGCVSMGSGSWRSGCRTLGGSLRDARPSGHVDSLDCFHACQGSRSARFPASIIWSGIERHLRADGDPGLSVRRVRFRQRIGRATVSRLSVPRSRSSWGWPARDGRAGILQIQRQEHKPSFEKDPGESCENFQEFWESLRIGCRVLPRRAVSDVLSGLCRTVPWWPP